MAARAICWISIPLLLAGCADSSGPDDAAPAVAPGAIVGKKDPTPAPGQSSGPKSRPEEGKTALATSAPEKHSLERDKPILYPVLRNYEEGDKAATTLVYRPITKGLGVFAFRITKDQASEGPLDYVKKSELPDYALTGPQLIDRCFENFYTAHLLPRMNRQGDDVAMHVGSSGGFSASLLGDAKTYSTLSKILHAENLAIYIGGRDMMLVTGKGSRFEAKFHEFAEKERAKKSATELRPAVYYWTKDGGPVLATKK